MALPRWSPSRRLGLVTALGCLLIAIYLLTFVGLPRTNDEWWLADVTESVARRLSYELNETLFTRGAQRAPDVDPLQPTLAAPLYWVGFHLPWAGNYHAVYFFNAIVTALTAILVYYYALALGYRERTALIAALFFGLTTIAWPYARTFFREPLTALNLLAAAYCWEQARRSFIAEANRRWLWLALALALTALALLSKESAIFLLPILALLGYSKEALARLSRRQKIAVGITLAALLLLALGIVLMKRGFLISANRRSSVLQLILGIPQALATGWEGFLGLMISPGRGIWWFSPVTLLGLASPWLLPRARWRESWLMIAIAPWFALAYISIRSDVWFGGAGWGARYMVPIIPFLLLAALPAIDRMLGSTHLWPKIALAGLGLIGVGVQIVGVYLSVYDFSDYLLRSTGDQPWLGAGIWSVRWSQIVGGLLFLPNSGTDLMWFYKGTDWLTLGVIGAGAILLAGYAWLLRPGREDARAARSGMVTAPVVVLALFGFVLWRGSPDPRYTEMTPQIEQLQADLERQAGPLDTVMLSDWRYGFYFTNTYKGQAIYYGLPNSPGERFSPEQPAKVVSDRVEDLIDERSVAVINDYLEGGARYTGHPIWIVSDASPFLTWATRPVEWYMAKYAYFVTGQDYASNARLAEYLPFRAPPTDQTPMAASGALFGDAIRLDGFDLAVYPKREGGGMQPGDTLGLSLVWEARGPITSDYTVAVHIISAAQTVIEQQDRQPMAGFAPTSKWKPGQRTRDNYGFLLPENIPPGRYELWATIYSWPSLEKLPVTGSDGRPAGTHVVLTTFEVQQP